MNNTFACPLFAVVCLTAVQAQAGSNAALMQNAKQRAFQLNSQVLQKLESIDSDDAALSFTGHAVRGPDGKLTISIDEVNTTPARYRSPAPSGTVEYITFEEMVESQKKAAESAPAPASQPNMRFGGGAAALPD